MSPTVPSAQRPVARWRMAAGIAVLAALAGFTALFAPVYLRNMRLQSYVSELTQRVENQTKADDLLRAWVLERAAQLELPVRAQNVQIDRTDDRLRIDVRYFVRISLPGYTVDLHFYPGAGSR